MGLIRSDMLCIAVSDYYDHPEFYRFMPESIFNLLEQAYLDGQEKAVVPEADFIRMITEMNLRNGNQDN